MFQIQLINQVVLWERRLDIEREKRKNQRIEPFRGVSTISQPWRKERVSIRSITAKIFPPGRDRPKDKPRDCHLVALCSAQERCQGAVPE